MASIGRHRDRSAFANAVSRTVPCRYDPVRFPLRPASAHPWYSSMARYIPSARKSPRANCPTEYANFTAKMERFPANLQAALFGFSHSLLKQEVSGLFVRPASFQANRDSGSKLQASDAISDHLIR